MTNTLHKKQVSPILVLTIGIVAVSTASVLIRVAQNGATSIAIAAWRLTFASIFIAPFALHLCRAEWKSLASTEWILAILSGLMLAIHFYSWITSLSLTSVAASVVLVDTHPIFVGLLSYILFRERLHPQMMLGLIITVSGSIIIGLGDIQIGTHQIFGDILAIIGAISVAVYMLIGRKLRSRLSLLAYIFPVYGTAAVALLLISLLLRANLIHFSLKIWSWLLLLGLIPQVIGHSSFNWALGHLPTTYVALSVLAEPIGSVILVWLILGERPSIMALAGGITILGGIYVASRHKNTGSM